MPQDQATLILVEAGPELFAMFKQDIRTYTAEGARGARRRGRCSARPVASVTPTRVTLKSGTELTAHTLVWGAGLAGRTRSSRRSALELERGEPDRRRAGADRRGPPRGVRVGDIAAITDAKTKKVLPQLGSVALQAGEHAGETIARLVAGKETKPFKLPRQGHDGDDRPRGGGACRLPRGRTMKGRTARSPGARCTSRCSRPARTARRRSSTGPGPASRTSGRAGSRRDRGADDPSG